MKIRSLVCSRRKLVVGFTLACALLTGCCAKKLNKDIPLTDLEARDRSGDFADVFCSLINSEQRPDGKSWGNCSSWLDKAKPRPIPLPKEIDSNFRFLLIAGFGSDCLSGPHATFMDSIGHLQSAHSYRAETLPVSAFGSSEFNAKQIAQYLNNQFATDQRKYIVLGYSKGTADLEVAIANEPGVKDKVAAMVTLAGVVKGSRLTSPPQATGQAKQTAAVSCTAGDGRGIQSMTPEVRNAFLAEHPNPLVPTYSVAACSGCKGTSKILMPFWEEIAQFGKIEDSQMIAAEAIYPRGSYLGLLKGDHWAIAIPFEPSVLVDKNDFPRPQLFEAILRFITADLKR